MTLSAAELARRLDGVTEGDAQVILSGMATPGAAGAEDLTVWRSVQGGALGAGACLVERAAARQAAGAICAIVVAEPLVAWARAAHWLPVRLQRAPVARGTPAHARSARIAPSAVVAEDASIGDACEIAAGASIGPAVVLGDHVRIESGARIGGRVRIGNRVRIGPGCVIGEDGFALVRDGTAWLRMPCCGGVVIGDDALLLGGTIVHAGVFGDTRIGAGVALDSQVLIGHDASVGDGTVISGHSAVAGAAVVGARCVIGAKVGIGEGIQIAAGVTITAMSMVTRSIATNGARYSSGWPAEPSGAWWRRVSRLRRLSRPRAPR
jgi:UDP-3-O-[3-hydroxymyristoyl] glucosamine N-acyltransferase